MNKIVKEALTKGKVLREELDRKKEEEDRKFFEAAKIKEAERVAALQVEAERLVSRIPEQLIKAIAERQESFSIIAYESYKDAEFASLIKLGNLNSKRWDYNSGMILANNGFSYLLTQILDMMPATAIWK